MWDYDGFIGKAQVYFQRAQDIEEVGDDAFVTWLLLGLEFLLRAPLAKVNPMLLADPTGPAILHAAGFSLPPDAKAPKSILIKTVIERLPVVIDKFSPDHKRDAEFLCGLRNRELHTSEAPLAAAEMSVWLPPFTRVVDCICQHLAIDAAALVGDLLTQGHMLVDQEDKRLSHEIAKRIESAKVLGASSAYVQPQVGARSSTDHRLACPACKLDVAIAVQTVRATNERLDDGMFIRDIVQVADRLDCPRCGLKLEGPAEFAAAGLPQQYSSTERQTFETRFLENYEPDDYGND